MMALSFFCAWILLSLGQSTLPHQGPEIQVGDRLGRIHCEQDYEAFVYAKNLSAPDGLCFDAEGQLVVVEETAGRITRIDQGGKPHILAQDLHSPEGICRGPDGTLYVTEDLAEGRLLAISPKGEVLALASGLDAPEGVVQMGDSIYITESTAQLSENFFAAHSRVSVLRRTEEGWSQPQLCLEVESPISFSEVVSDGAGGLILANEVAGGMFVRKALWHFDLSSKKLSPFASGLKSPEGLAITPGDSGPFPLYVAEENADGKGHGRISQVDENGKCSIFATGFFTLEDAVVAADGSIYVSEDATGLIIVLRPLLKQKRPRSQ